MSISHTDKYQKEKRHREQNEFIKHLKMMFTPSITLAVTVLVILLSLVLICLISSLFHLYEKPLARDVIIALYTGIIASGFVSLALEISKNYTTNNKALILLLDYYLALAQMSQLKALIPIDIDLDKSGKESSLVLELFSYQTALKAILSISDIEKTFLNEKEILSLKSIEMNGFANKILDEDDSKDELSDSDMIELNDLIKALSVLEEEMLKKPYYGSLITRYE